MNQFNGSLRQLQKKSPLSRIIFVLLNFWMALSYWVWRFFCEALHIFCFSRNKPMTQKWLLVKRLQEFVRSRKDLQYYDTRQKTHPKRLPLIIPSLLYINNSILHHSNWTGCFTSLGWLWKTVPDILGNIKKSNWFSGTSNCLPAEDSKVVT